MLKPIQNVSSPASLGLKDEEDDDGDGEDGEADGEKPDPTNVHPERLKAFNVSDFLCTFVTLCSCNVEGIDTYPTSSPKNDLTSFLLVLSPLRY